MITDLLYRVRALLFRRSVERDLDDELQFHVEHQAAEYVRRGLPQAEALRRARLDLAGPEQVKEACRDARGTRWLEDFVQDLRFGFRTLRKDRGYTVAAVGALAVGIGANAALFTLFTAIVLKPLPVPDPAAVVALHRSMAQSPFSLMSYADYAWYRDHATLLSSVAAEQPAHLRIVSPAAEPLMGLFVSANYLATFGVAPAAGRDFLPAEERLTAPPYPMLISDNYWQRRFARDPSVLGRQVQVSGIPMLIVGVTPRDFMGTRPDVPDVWPIMAALGDVARREQDRAALCCGVTAHLKPGATLAQAQSEIAALTATLRGAYPPEQRQWNVRAEAAVPFGPAARNFRGLYLILQAAMALVLLIACSNVAGLFLGRAAARQKEIALRLAIGAGRGRIVRQLVAECLLLATFAAAGSLFVVWQLLETAVRFAGPKVASGGGSLALDVTPDYHVLLYILAVGSLAGISFALAPALHASRPELATAMKEESTGGADKGRLRGWLVACQIGVCLALLIGASMLAASSLRLLSFDPGFQARGVMTLSLSAPEEAGYTGPAAVELRSRIEQRLRALPNVAAVASASHVPLGNNARTTSVAADGAAALDSPYSYVSRDYFDALRLPLVRGRGFTAAEIASDAPVAIVSEALARKLWPGQDPLGKRIAIGSRTATRFAGEQAPLSASSEVIAIAKDVYNLTPAAPDPAYLYLPWKRDDTDRFLFVRFSGDAPAAFGAANEQIRAVEPKLSIAFDTLDHAITGGEAAVSMRVGAVVFAAIGLIGFALAAVGIASMVGYSVARQTREIGIRMALGAGHGQVVRFLLAGTLRWIVGGVVGGAALGVGTSRVLSSLLQGIHLLDPLVLVAVCALTAGLGLVAAWIPARRAARVDPATTLRAQ
jgi:predicted permease